MSGIGARLRSPESRRQDNHISRYNGKETVMKFIDEIADGIPYDAAQVRGYNDDEIYRIEKLYDIRVDGALRRFLSEMGRCSGGLIGDDAVVLYRASMSVRGFVLLNVGKKDDIINGGFRHLATEKFFIIAIESDTQFFYIRTASSQPDAMYQYDENSDKVWETGETLTDYLKRVAKQQSTRQVVCHGELIEIK
jgi:hypothetical protein